MRFPKEFQSLLLHLRPDLLPDLTQEEVVAGALIAIGKQQRQVVKWFLDDLLSRPYEPEALKAAWWKSSVDFAPTDAKEIPPLFKLIRELIDSPRVQADERP